MAAADRDAGASMRTTLTAHAAASTTVEVMNPAPAEVRALTSRTPQEIFDTDPRWRPGLLVAVIVAGLVLAAAALAVIAYFLWALGPTVTLIGAVFALVPLAIVLIGVRWIDRWEPEPRLLQLLALLWGGAASIAIALLVGAGLSLLYAAGGADVDTTIFYQVVFQAPIVEEIGKGLGLLLIYLVARRYFDGPVDGIVFGALIGAGFAFTENVQYFAIEILESGQVGVDVGIVFFLRGILSPFSHVMFTAALGFFVGLAARRGTALGGVAMFVVGLVPAIGLHMLWNGALFVVYDWLVFYVVVQVPLFLLTIVGVILLRRHEARMTQLRLGEYAAAGWFNPTEVNTLGTAAGRRQARAWARARGMGPLMNEYIHDATHLAFTRNRIVSGRDRIGSQSDEAVLLLQVSESRRRLMAATPPAT